MISTSNILRNKKLDIPMLDINNYADWSMIVTFTLKAEDLWDIVDGTELPPNPPTDRDGARTRASSSATIDISSEAHQQKLLEYKKRSNRAAAVIFCSLTPRVRGYLKGHTEPAAMWKALERHTNAARTTAGATNLRMKFMNDKLKDSDTISDYVSRLIGYQTQLVHTNEALSDRTVITQILNTLPSKFEGIIRHIKDKPISDQTIDSVLDTLLEHERTTYLPEPLESQALFTRKPSNGRKPHHDRNKGFKSRHPYRRDKTQAPTCWYCTREGHR